MHNETIVKLLTTTAGFTFASIGMPINKVPDSTTFAVFCFDSTANSLMCKTQLIEHELSKVYVYLKSIILTFTGLK